MAFVDLEKAFDRVPRKVIWWALRKLGVEEWIVRLVQGMYANARSRHNGQFFPPVSFFPGERMGRPILSPWKDLTSQFFPHPISFSPHVTFSEKA